MSEVRGNMSRRRDLTGNVQLVGNMVTEVSESSTDSQYPSAKAVEARVKKSEEEHVDTLLIRGAPYNTTKGAVGQLAIDTYTGYNHVYKCVAVNEDGTYTWENIDHPSQNNFYIKDIDIVWGTADGYGVEYEPLGLGPARSHGEKFEAKVELFLNNEVVYESTNIVHIIGGIKIYDHTGKYCLITIWEDAYWEDDGLELSGIEYDYVITTLKGTSWVHAVEYNTKLDGFLIQNNSIFFTSLKTNTIRELANYYNKNGKIKTIGNLSCGEQEGSLYTFDATPDNLGLGAFAGGYKGQATTEYSFTDGMHCVVGVKGYAITEILPNELTFKLKNYADVDDNDACTPQLTEGVRAYFLHKGDTWNISHRCTVVSVSEDGVVIEGLDTTELKSWTPENTPLLLLSPENIQNSPWKLIDDEYLPYVMGDMLTYGPDAIPLTSEMVSELTANNIKVGRGRRGIALNHLGVTIGDFGVSYNNRAKTIANSAITGGQECWNRAGGGDVHGERCQTLPTARFTFVRGGFNIAYAEYGGLWGVGNYLYTRGGTGRGTYAEKDTEAKYLDFIGIGTNSSNRANGYTFDKQGNAWYKGRIKVGGAGYDDPESAYIATIGDVNTAIDSVMAEIIEVQKAIVGGGL